MNLNELRDEAYSVAKTNGWHEEEHSDKHYLMLIITEIAEAVQADRNGISPDIDGYKVFIEAHDETCVAYAYNHFIKGCLEEELADVVIRCLDLAGLRDIDFRYADMLLSEGVREVQVPFPELMYLACEEITYHGYDLTEKLNALVAGIIAYCNQKDMDLDFLIRTKMNYTRLRGYHHGGKKY